MHDNPWIYIVAEYELCVANNKGEIEKLKSTLKYIMKISVSYECKNWQKKKKKPCCF